MVVDDRLADAATAAARLTAQGLAAPSAGSPDEVAGRLLAVQAQDLAGARLAVRARSDDAAGLRAGDVDAALDDRRLVVDWLCRGTLHLVRAADHARLHALTTPQLATGSARRLRQEGVSPQQADRGAAVVAEQVADGPRSRAQLSAALAAAGVPVAGQALVHVLLSASLRGLVLRGPVVAGEQHFVAPGAWLGEGPRPLGGLQRRAALSWLARRYLAGHGPASARDLATWAGIGLREARAGLAGLGEAVRPVPGPPGDLVALVAGAGEAAPPLPAPRLLGPFDPVLHGWAARDWVLGTHGRLVTSNGIFRPVLLVGGRAVGTWRRAGGRVALEPFEPLAADVLAALEADAARVEAFLAG